MRGFAKELFMVTSMALGVGLSISHKDPTSGFLSGALITIAMMIAYRGRD